MHCAQAYQAHLEGRDRQDAAPDVGFAGLLRKRSLVPVISDFLLEDPAPLLDELADLATAHDVFLVMIDSAFAFTLPALSAGWIEGLDVETGRTRLIAASDLRELGDRVASWQDGVEQQALDRGLEMLRLDSPDQPYHETLVAFLLERKQLRR